jgi:hypothetical protein
MIQLSLKKKSAFSAVGPICSLYLACNYLMFRSRVSHLTSWGAVAAQIIVMSTRSPASCSPLFRAAG